MRVKQDPYEEFWRSFVSSGRVSRGSLRRDIVESWKRCKFHYGLDPYARPKPVKLSSQELLQRRQENGILLGAAKPFLEVLSSSVRGSGFIITLADKDGYVLEVSGDEEIMEMARANNYLPGCKRSEDEVGTNAIGLSLLLRRPVQITGYQHYNVNHHPWTCSSCPVFSPERELLGSVTLSGRSKGIHQHTLGMAVSAAKAMEKQLREEQLAREKAGLSSYLETLLDSVSEGIVAIGEKGRVTHMNRVAQRMLGISARQLLGKSFGEAAGMEQSFWEKILSESDLKDLELSLNLPGKAGLFVVSVRPVETQGRILGKILILTERRRVNELIQRFGGNQARFTFEDIKGEDPKLKRQIELGKIAAKTGSRVLLVGESGTGKELFAQAIHNESPRKAGPFVAVSCAAVPRELIEAELFGYREGAFTGARKGGQIGKFELADGGTLFLDEISSMPLEMQAKLLRVLQEGEVMRLGDERPRRVDVRIIAAANTDLMEEVQNRNFREDLYFRLNVVEIFIPPLRERKEDLPVLVEHILGRISTQLQRSAIRISREAMGVMAAYSWPGNVRELENCLERASILCEGDLIQVKHLPRQLLMKREKDLWEEKPERPLQEWEEQIIARTLARCDGNISQCARRLGVSRSTLHRRMKQMGMNKKKSYAL
ncbi:MAG: sigma-54-dependent Fis family transcriptional regulator [bacterium]